MKPSITPPVLLSVLIVLAGCVGGPAFGTTQSPDDAGSSGSGVKTDTPTGPESASGPPEDGTESATHPDDCPADTERFQWLAEEHVATETDNDRENVTVLKGAFVTYEVLNECYYHAKVRNAATSEIVGVMVASNETIVNREAVERRAKRAYRETYGKLGTDLYDRLHATADGDAITVTVHLTGINRTDAKREVARRVDPNDTTAFKRALSEEVEERAQNKTQYWAAQLRDVAGVTVTETHPITLTVDIEATPAGIERIEQFDAVTRIALYEPTSTAVPVGGDTQEAETETSRGDDG